MTPMSHWMFSSVGSTLVDMVLCYLFSLMKFISTSNVMMINVLFVIKTNTVTMHTLKLASYSAKKKKSSV